MRKILWLLGALFCVVGVAYATSIVYSGYLANETVAYAKSYVLDLKLDGRNGRSIDTVTATVALSSPAVSAVAFTDGSCSTGSFTVASLTNIAGAYASNYLTVLSTSNLNNQYVTVNGKKLRKGYEWGKGTTLATTATAAADIARIADFLATVSASTTAATVVTLTAETKGTAGNAYTLATSSAPLISVNAATFSGGLNPAILTINGIAIPVASTDTTAHCATMIAESINANATLAAILTAVPSSSDVVLTAKAVGVNAYTLESNFAGITASGAAMTGGTASSYALNGHVIASTAHGLTTGVPMLYEEGDLALDPLVDGTTYYAIRSTADTFELSTTSTGSIAGSYITFTSSSVAGPHTFTLTPTDPTGTWGFYWQVSDDDTNWTNVVTSSVTFATPFTASTTSWDLGAVNHRYLKGQVAAGSGGSIKIELSATGRNTN